MSVFRRYQRTLSATVKKKIVWNETEDNQLRALVSQYGDANWKKIAYYMKNRNEKQCARRWINSLIPTKIGGKWSPQEDERLRMAIQIFGPNYSQVEELMINRTDVQVRERWVNALQGHKNYHGLEAIVAKPGGWTPVEDEQLLQVVHDIGLGRWQKIAKKLGHYHI